MTRILRMNEIEEHLTIDDCISALEVMFKFLHEGDTMTDARVDVLTPASDPPKNAEPPVYHGLKSMSGSIPELGVAAIRTNSDIIQWKTHEETGEKVRDKIPAANGRYTAPVLLFSTDTGEPLLIFPDGLVQSYRVGATSALGAKYLSRQDASILGMLGAGQQARHHLLAIAAIRDLETVKVYSPTLESRNKFAEEMSKEINADIDPVDEPQMVFKDADIVQAATNSLSPVFDVDWIESGTHMGVIRYSESPPEFFTPENYEVFAQAWPDTTRVEEVATQVTENEYKTWTMNSYISEGDEPVPRLANHPDNEPLCDWGAVPGLGEIITQDSVNRSSPEDITGFYNAGLGVQFAAVGKVLHDLANENNLGINLDTEVFTQEYHP